LILHQLIAYINYWLRQVDEHSLHSPFVYRLYTELIKGPLAPDQEIEALRNTLKKDQTTISLTDLGAGSRVSSKKERRIASIAKFSASPPKFSIFLQKLIELSNAKRVWELGTSLGLNTLYMAKAKEVEVVSFEGDPALAHLAAQHFELTNSHNITLVQGDIDQTLPIALQSTDTIDLVYLDANHSYAATLNYVQQLLPHMSPNGILVLDDIHWSKGMERAWKQIRKEQHHSLSIDLFDAGLLFLNKDLPQADYILKF